MRNWVRFFLIWLVLCGSVEAKLSVVAAENFYGILAKTIGGDSVDVTIIMNNPLQDPHLFSNTPATAVAFSKADVVIYNGLDYDPWVKKLLEARKGQPPVIIVVADLLGRAAGDNPHIWYDPKTMPLFAETYCKKLVQLDPEHGVHFVERFEKFKEEYQSLLQRIVTMRKQFLGTPVIATEPLFNDMAEALGLSMKGLGFQMSVMNETQPTSRDLREFETFLKKKRVKALIYNTQVTNPYTKKMNALAEKNEIAIVGVSEMQPAEKTYIQWMTSQLQALENVLK